jgi:hypothetical protein
MEVNTSQKIYLSSPRTGGIRISKKWVSKKLLLDLFQIEDLLIFDLGEKIVFFLTASEQKKPVLVNEDLSHLTSTNYLVMSSKDRDSLQSNPTKQEIHVLLARTEKMKEARQKFIATNYKPLHPELWTFDEVNFSMFNPKKLLAQDFVKAMKSFLDERDPDPILQLLKKETSTGIYSFDFLKPEVCQQWCDEIDNFENSGLPLIAPNTMNNYGVILSEWGFDPFFNGLTKYLAPLAHILYDNIGSDLDNQHSFIVFNFHFNRIGSIQYERGSAIRFPFRRQRSHTQHLPREKLHWR